MSIGFLGLISLSGQKAQTTTKAGRESTILQNATTIALQSAIRTKMGANPIQTAPSINTRKGNTLICDILGLFQSLFLLKYSMGVVNGVNQGFFAVT